MPPEKPSTVAELLPGDRLHEVASAVALLRAAVVPANRLGPMIEEAGSAVELVQQSEDDRLLTFPAPIHDVIGAVTDEGLADAYTDAASWLAEGLDLRLIVDVSYPEPLREIFNRPAWIIVEGRYDAQQDAQAVAVVGTREASDAGLQRARRLSLELAESGVTIASGMAAGIDTAAHTAALDAGGRTFAVMGTGIRRRYPKENAPLADRIVEAGGSLLSQFQPQQPPTQWSFPNRNITMSGLSLATVVVEASSTSGAKMQARVALQHGRTVFLLRSLVETHVWARKYVEEGAYGTAAIMVDRTSDILDRLRPSYEEVVIEAVG